MKKVANSKSEGGLPGDLPKPALHALIAAGYTTLASLKNFNEAELLKLHGVGPKAIRILREHLQDSRIS